MSHCHALVRIPTSPDSPSMNLGQAVAVCAYELARASVVSVRPPSPTVHVSGLANHQTVSHIFDRTVSLLDASGYLQPKSREAMLIKLRRVLFDLSLTTNDARIIGGALTQVEWKLGQIAKAK